MLPSHLPVDSAASTGILYFVREFMQKRILAWEKVWNSTARPLDLNHRLAWIQPHLAILQPQHQIVSLEGWELGYFFRGWMMDRFAADEARPVGLFLVLAILAMPIAAVPCTSSAAVVLALLFWCMCVTGGFQMPALRMGARAYPREQTGLVGGTHPGRGRP